MRYTNKICDDLFMAWTQYHLKPTPGMYDVTVTDNGVIYDCEVSLKYFLNASGNITDEAVLIHSVRARYEDMPERLLDRVPSPDLRSLFDGKWHWRHYTININNF